MALSDVTFITTDGGLGRNLAGDDATSALIFTGADPGQDTSVFYSVKEAEAAGVTATDYPELHFHITTFFARVAAPLYVHFLTGTDYTAAFEGLQAFAEGAIRQVGVIGATDFATSQVSALQAAAAAVVAEHQGLSVLFAPKFPGTATLATLPTLTTLTAPQVSVIIGADFTTNYSCLGDALGTVASAKVSECIGYVKKFNSATGDTFDQLAFTTGQNYKSVSTALLNQLNDKGYTFLRKYVGIAGSYYSDSKTATSSTSDYSTIENVRTLEKAIRQVRAALLPELNAPLKLSAGKLSQQTLTKFELLVQNPLGAMVDADELSEFSIFISPTQNVLATSKLEIQVGLTPLGVARQIQVPIGFQVKTA